MQDRRVRIGADCLTGVKRPDDVGMLQLGNGPDLREKPHQHARMYVARHRQNLDRHQPPHADMFGFVNRSHAPGRHPVEYPVVSQHESEGLAGSESRDLVGREEVELAEVLQHLLGIGFVFDDLRDRIRQRLPVLSEYNGRFEEFLEQPLGWGTVWVQNIVHGRLRAEPGGIAARGFRFHHGERSQGGGGSYWTRAV